MCGIAGVIASPGNSVDAGLISRLLGRLKHRGPDDQGYILLSQDSVRLGRDWPGQDAQADAVLLHRRLAILDLTEAGWQPMGSADGRHYIVFNGEIYNYLELRRELQDCGHRFRSRSDTEVLLAAYIQWGNQALVRLVGMFAFAILDTWTKRLFLARDMFGIKPLYYGVGDGFAFASEITALLEVPWISRRVNPDRLHLYLRHGLTDHGSETLFADVRQLAPAHYLEVCLDGSSPAHPVSYWRADLSRHMELSFDEAAEHLRELFLKSIRLHLRSDVPIGVALSGGIDSSSIVVAMRYCQGRDLELHAFSYVADDAAISEEPWVDLAGRVAGAEVHKVHITAQESLADLRGLIEVQGEPFGSTSIYAQYRVFRLAHELGIKVMLDGQGADELLAGYRFYMAARLASLLRQARWSEAGDFLRRASEWPGVGVSWLLFMSADYFMPQWLQGPMRYWVGKDLVPHWLNAAWFAERGVVPRSLNAGRSKEVLRDHLFRDLSETSLPHLLRYEDRNSMAFSIESRVPFLTPELMNFVFSLPEDYIISRDGTSKAVFRKAMRGIVPDLILDRKDKVGFATPERNWLMALRPWVERTLRTEVAGQIPALNLKEMGRELEDLLEGRKLFDSRVWRWLNLIEWTRLFEVRYE